MTRRTALRAGRRWQAPRRPFYCHVPALLLAALAALPGAISAQPSYSVRIMQRQVRVARDETGSYRVVEALALLIYTQDGEPISLPTSLRLLRLPDRSTDVLGLGGDIAAGQVRYDPPDLAIMGSLPVGPLEFVAAYSLPPDAEGLVLRAYLPVQQLLVHVDRGTVEARPGVALRPAEEEAVWSRRRVTYVAERLQPDSTVSVRFVHRRIGWLERLAVLLATGLAATLAGLWVWRGAPSGPREA